MINIDYINFKINGINYRQRNQYSKLIATLANGTEKIIDNYNELSDYMQEIIETSILIRHNPENYFKYIDIIGLDNCIFITDYIKTNLKHVIIPEEINGKKVVGLDGLFKNNTHIKTIIIPETVKEINEYFCANATNLRYVNLSTQLKEIPLCSFLNCKNLNFINTNNVEIIGKTAFKNCINLKTINLKNLKQIDGLAFANCEELTEVDAPNLTIGNSAVFLGCANLKKVRLNDDFKNINSQMFNKCIHLVDFKLPNNIETIGRDAFCECYSLESITFPKTLKHIEIGAFAYSGLSGPITFPETIEQIEPFAFTETNITEINISKNTKYNQEAFPIEALTKLNVYDDTLIKDNFIDKDVKNR